MAQLKAKQIVGTKNRIVNSASGTINWNMTANKILVINAVGNVTIANPTAIEVDNYTLIFRQDATGSRTISWGSAFKWPSGIAPTASTAANAVDVFSFTTDGTNIFGFFGPDLR